MISQNFLGAWTIRPHCKCTKITSYSIYPHSRSPNTVDVCWHSNVRRKFHEKKRLIKQLPSWAFPKVFTIFDLSCILPLADVGLVYMKARRKSMSLKAMNDERYQGIQGIDCYFWGGCQNFTKVIVAQCLKSPGWSKQNGNGYRTIGLN